jgi:beta-1,4-mannosyltransferase
VRVLMSPATGGDNHYVDQLVGRLRLQGVVVEEFTRRACLSRPDVVHVHWPQFLVRWDRISVAVPDAVKVLVLLSVARARGARLVWTAHDLRPHHNPHPRLWKAFISVFARLMNVTVSLTEAGRDPLCREVPALRGKHFQVIPHGHYREVVLVADRRQARAELGRHGQVLLTFGQLHHYKNADGLISAFRASSPASTSLVVAGQPREAGVREAVQAAAGGDPRVELRLNHIGEHEVSMLFAAADVVVLTHRGPSVLNSGVAMLALSFDRPIVAPDTPANRELVGAVGREWVRLSDGSPDDAVRVALELLADLPAGSPDLSSYEWDRVAELTLQAYRGRPALG